MWYELSDVQENLKQNTPQQGIHVKLNVISMPGKRHFPVNSKFKHYT